MKKYLAYLAVLVLSILAIVAAVDAAHADTGSCPQYEQLLATYNPGWDIQWMSHRMWIESKCNPNASNGTHEGLLQIANSWNHKMTNYLDIQITDDNKHDAELNVLLAAVLFHWQLEHGRDPYQPWGGR